MQNSPRTLAGQDPESKRKVYDTRIFNHNRSYRGNLRLAVYSPGPLCLLQNHHLQVVLVGGSWTYALYPFVLLSWSYNLSDLGWSVLDMAIDGLERIIEKP
jgi:hypothetical protein